MADILENGIKAEPTPGEWDWSLHGDTGFDWVIYAKPGDVIVATVRRAIDAQRICRAINAHDDTLKALKAAGEAIHSEYCGRKCQPQCVAVEAAIAKAEGK